MYAGTFINLAISVLCDWMASVYIMSLGENCVGMYSSVDVRYAVLRDERAAFHDANKL